MAKKNVTPCPLCGREFNKLSLHTCPEQPAIVDWLSRNLPHPGRPGYILPLAEFEAIDQKPICAPALKRQYRTWSGLAARYGLKCPPPTGGEGRRPSLAGTLTEEEIAELRRLADVLHAGEYGPSTSEFDLHAEGLKISRVGLAGRFASRSWHDVLAAAGLRSGTHSQYTQSAIGRKRERGIPLVNPDRPSRQRYRYERGDDPIPRDCLGIPVAEYNRIDGRRRPKIGYTWTVI